MKKEYTNKLYDGDYIVIEEKNIVLIGTKERED